MSQKVLTAALAVCLFLLIVGAKWATFARFGSPMPDWDQWDAEGAELFIPWFERDHFWKHLFHPHNEHRVILTKLQNLAVGLMNGQWDSRLEAVVNACLHATLGVAFWIFGRRWIGGRTADARSAALAVHPEQARTPALLSAFLFVVIAALFGLPNAWQNVLGGFHSQQYWLLGLSFIVIVTLPLARPWTAPWWIGVAAAILAFGSMGSGFLAAPVVLVLLVWRMLRRETTWRDTAPTVLLALLLIAAGLLTRVEFPGHKDLKAATVHDFIFSMVHSLEWPWRGRDWATIVLWLPWALVIGRIATRREGENKGGLVLAGLGGWVLIQVVATAYARGVGADYPASRYMDTLAFGATVNGVAVAWLLAAPPGPLWLALGRYVLALGWIFTLGFGLRYLWERSVWYELPDAKKYYDKAERNMRRYLATDDRKHLPYPDIPFPDVNLLIHRLAQPSLRAMMPEPIRAPLPVVAATGPAPFSENDGRSPDPDQPSRAGLSPQTPPLDGAKTWGSFQADTQAAAASGTWRSAAVKPTLGGWLKIELAGQIDRLDQQLSLELRDAQTDALLASVRPRRTPGEAWHAVHVRTPSQPFVLVAHDRDPARWFAFSAPTEMGGLSYWAWRATQHGWQLVYATALATVLLGGCSWWVGRKTPETTRSTPA